MTLAGDYSINTNDIYIVGDSLVQSKGLVDHHLSSANDLYEIGIPQIIEQVFNSPIRFDDIKRVTEEEKLIDHVIVQLVFSNVFIAKPTILNYTSRKEEILMPNMALVKEKTYKSNLTCNVKIVATAYLKNGSTIVREAAEDNFKLCRIPIMVKSKLCNTYNLSKEALLRLHEEPSDPGGYFIIRGVEWVIDCVENILFNKVRIFNNEGYKKEVMRAEFISKPGDFYLNSDQFIVRWLNDGQLTIELRCEKLGEIFIPFYVIFRILGWNNDKEIFDNMLLTDDPVSKNISRFLMNAFGAKYVHLAESRHMYSQADVLRYFAETIQSTAFAYLDVKTYPENYQKITRYLQEYLDAHFLQHMGSHPGARNRKLRYLCMIIRKLFLVYLGNMEQTDRDSYNSKRIHTAGTNFAKSFKTHFNSSIIMKIKRKLAKDFKSVSFGQIDFITAIKSSAYGDDFERAIMQVITTGNKSQSTIGKQVRNRLSTQLLNRKNQLNTYSTLRQVTVISSDSAKQSERASEMRKVHMSFLGYICIVHSPEGERVGVNKQLAIFSFITRASSSEVIKETLLNDEDVFPLDPSGGNPGLTYKDILSKQLCPVYVNGDWIGCTTDALAFAKKYRHKRRNFEISPEITIVWDNTQDEVYFWTDVGRVIRPLLIVYNNLRDPEHFPKDSYKKHGFKQCLKLTQKHIDLLYQKEIDFDYLLKENIVELITAEEQENMFLAPSFDVLRENASNELLEYTHCDIPQAMLGLTALTSPFASHNQAQRIVYQTSQSKQTCGLFAKNWPYRADKDTFLQYHNESPIVRTVVNSYLYPNGLNCIVALMCYSGFNVEDSLIISKGAIDRGIFDGCKFSFYKTELEQKEVFANPNANTMDVRTASYNKLENGIIKKGTIVHRNDAIIGKLYKLTENTDEAYQYVDRSVIYKEDEPCIVTNVIRDRNEDDEEFCKVVVKKLRPVNIGDKFSSKPESQVLTDHGWLELKDLDMKKHKVATLTKDGNLDYVYPSGISKYDYDGEMYYLKTQQLFMQVTRNHKLYVKRRDKDTFELLETPKVFGKRVRFKKWAESNYPDIEKFHATDEKGNVTIYPMDAWLKLLGIFIADGNTVTDPEHRYIKLSATKQRKKDFHMRLLDELGVKYKMFDHYTSISPKYKAIFNELDELSVGALNKRLPSYVWNLSQRQSKILLNSLIEGDGSYNSNGSASYYTSSPGLADDISRLALHAGWSGNVKTFGENSGKKKGDSHVIFSPKTGKTHVATNQADCLYVRIVKTKNEPQINHGHVKEQDAQEEKYIHYSGPVICLEIPDTHQHVYYARESMFDPPSWSGNSARSG